MKHLPSPGFALLLAIACLFVVGCSEDDPAEPEPEVYRGLEGHVVDGDGNPLADVAIGIVYDIPGLILDGKKLIVLLHPADKPQTGFGFSLPEPGHIELWLTDYAGQFVVTLLDEDTQAGYQETYWDATDEDGNLVPSGAYYYHLEVDGVPGDEGLAFLQYLDPEEFLAAPNAVTDADGRFRVPDRLIPVGEVLEGVNESGESTDPVVLGDTLRIRAVQAGDSDPVWTQVLVVYEKGEENSGVEIVLQ